MSSPLASRDVGLLVVLLTAVGCTPSSSPSSESSKRLVLYLGRSKQLCAELIERFEKESGITVEVRDGPSGVLALRLKEEGEKSPADVFWSQDVGSLSVVSALGFFSELPGELLARVPATYQSREKHWVATSGRARVLAYSPARVSPSELPKSVFELTDDRWKGRVGWAPQNASFQAFVTAMRQSAGEEKTRRWLEGMVEKNKERRYPKNTPILEALAAGEIDVGLPNHYYLLRFKSKDKDYPVEQTFFEAGDIGNLVNVAGAGILKTSKNREGAEAFLEFLVSADAQGYFANTVFEYPVTAGAKTHPLLVAHEKLLEAAPDVDLAALEDHQATIELLKEVGAL